MNEDNVICAAVLPIEMIDYLTMPTMPHQLEFFKKLGKVGSALEGGFDPTKMDQGTILFNMYAVVDP